VNFKDLFTISRWFNPFPEPPSPIYLFLIAFFVVWTIASIYVYRFRRRIFAGNGALIGIVTRFGPWAITIGAIGLILLAVRYAGIPYIEIRFLLYLSLLSTVAFAAYVVYYLRRRYPRQLAAVRAEEVRRRYTADRRKKRRR
jgi:amino acid permease